MRWHIEVLIEAVLIAILWRKSVPRWFAILIGVHFCANLLQIIPYRIGLLAHSQLIWCFGVVITAPLLWMALAETLGLDLGRVRFYHPRILAFWTVAQLTCITFQTQRGWLVPANHVLLICDSAAFLGWIALFMLS